MADPDYIYDPDNWEYTMDYADRGDIAEGIDVGEVREFATLEKGPAKFAAHVVVSRDDDGDPDETEIRWFDTEAGARAATSPNRQSEEG